MVSLHKFPLLLSVLLLTVLTVFDQCAASVSDCRAVGEEFEGLELPYGTLTAGSAEECQLKCRNAVNCEFFTYWTNSRWNLCSLRAGNFVATKKKNRISGLPRCSGTCIEAGVDYYGSDLPDGLVKNVTSSAACQRLCQQRKDCEFFAWAYASDSSCRHCYRNCWLKSGSYIRTENDNRISGPARCTDTCIVEGVDYYGSDLSDGLVKNVKSVEDCQNLCLKRPDCEFFTWAPGHEHGCPHCRHNCWLKSGNYRRYVNANRISGAVKCN